MRLIGLTENQRHSKAVEKLRLCKTELGGRRPRHQKYIPLPSYATKVKIPEQNNDIEKTERRQCRLYRPSK